MQITMHFRSFITRNVIYTKTRNSVFSSMHFVTLPFPGVRVTAPPDPRGAAAEHAKRTYYVAGCLDDAGLGVKDVVEG